MRDDCLSLVAAMCTTPQESEVCGEYNIKWLFDTTAGMCTRSWDSGCDVDVHRFDSQEDCSSVCVDPPGYGKTSISVRVFVTVGFTTASFSAFVPRDTSSPAFNVIEQFTCAMYDSTTQHNKVNDLRLQVFPNMVKLMERLPSPHAPTCQQMCVPGQYLDTESETGHCCPEGFGWSKSDTGWHPVWTTVPAAAVACRELIRCGCKAAPMCSKKCKCE